jgi:hypothetical protein
MFEPTPESIALSSSLRLARALDHGSLDSVWVSTVDGMVAEVIAVVKRLSLAKLRLL